MEWKVELRGAALDAETSSDDGEWKGSSVSCGKLLRRAARLKVETACALAELGRVEVLPIGDDGHAQMAFFSSTCSPGAARESCIATARSGELTLTDENAIVRHVMGGSDGTIESLSASSFEEAVLRPALYEGGQRLKDALELLEGGGQEGGAGGALGAFVRGTVTRRIREVGGGAGGNLGAVDVILFGALCCLHCGRSAAADTFIDAVLASLPPSFAAKVQKLRPSEPPLPRPTQRNVLITSALPYVNNVPHLGNIIGCVLSADVYARYCRSRGDNVLYVCGTDEYGTATETKAFEMGVSPREICDHFHEIHRSVYEWFMIDFDHFGRTSTRTQTQIAQKIFRDLHEGGMLQEQTQEQLYSDKLGKFLADRYVVGTCPKCKYEDARGDQCDQCGSLLNPTELIDARCKFTGSVPRIVPSQHLFIDLPKLTGDLAQYVKDGGNRWSSNCMTITNTWLRDGLKPRCITRDLSWGTPVPVPGYEKKVFYVWFDAPIGYISITAALVDEWERWWKNPREVELVQFMGKDNVPFHTIIFPSTLLGTKQDWTMMHRISVTEYLNYENGKFSKSRGVGVFGNDVQETGISVDVFRYYLLSMRPEQSDTVFMWSDLQEKNNSELLANLGNFCNRALKFTAAQFGGAVPQGESNSSMMAKADEFGAALVPTLRKFTASMGAMKMKEALYVAMSISRLGNGFMQDSKPWVIIKEDAAAAGTAIASLLGVVRLLAIVFRPFMPGFSDKLRSQGGFTLDEVSMLPDALIEAASRPYMLVEAGRRIGSPEPIFVKIADEQVAELRERYAGTQVTDEDTGKSKNPASSSGGSDSKKKKKEKKKNADDNEEGKKDCRDAGKGT